MTEPTDPTVSTPAEDAVSVLSSVAAGVGTITLNRPAVNNAYDGALLAGVVEAAARLAGDAAVRLLVIRANGRHFQAGADLKWLRAIAARDEAANLAASHQTAQAMRSLNEIGKPVLALVHGACIGGGTGLIASCDIVVAEATATFAISEARWGLTAAIIFPQLVAAIGIRQLRRYALTCETFDARRARELGLVHEVCEAGALDTTAAPLIDALLRAAPEAVGRSKRFAMQCAQTLPSEATWRQLEAEHGSRRRSAEAAEGLDSFRSRRDPAWVKNLERSSR
ncbi:MAG: enoyl-CoA hydratase-related protein [Burkholderiaceae bacterium]